MEDLNFRKLNMGKLADADICITENKYSDIPVYIFEEVSSTNIIAKGLVTGGDPEMPSDNLVCNCFGETKDAIPHGTIVIADAQTAGRGRLGRSFASPAGSGLYMSIVLRPDAESGDKSGSSASSTGPAMITIAAAVAVVRALKSEFGISADIKWVNDILVNDKKICGILAEGMVNPKTGTLDAVILGIGVNLKVPAGGYPEELAGIVTTVEEVLCTPHPPQAVPLPLKGKAMFCTPHPSATLTPSLQGEGFWPAVRNRLALAIATNVLDLTATERTAFCEPETTDAERTSLIEEYKASCTTIGKDILVYRNGLGGEAQSAKAIDIDENGGLIVRYENTKDSPENKQKTETLTFGEISIR